MWFLSQIKQILQLNVQLAENDKATPSQTFLFCPDKTFLFVVEYSPHASAAAEWHPAITSVIKVQPLFVLSSIKLCLFSWMNPSNEVLGEASECVTATMCGLWIQFRIWVSYSMESNRDINYKL